MGAVYAGLLLERSDAFCATTPHHQIVRTVCQITSSLGQIRTDFNDHLILSTAFLNSCDFCGERRHDRHAAALRRCKLAKIESSTRRK